MTRTVVDAGLSYTATTVSRRCECGDVQIVRVRNVGDEPVWPVCCKDQMKQRNPLKPRYLDVPTSMLDAFLLAKEYGDAKYGERTWLRVSPDDLLQAAERHIRAAWNDPLAADESGLPHLFHALASIAMVIEQRYLDEEHGYAEYKAQLIKHSGHTQTNEGG